MRDTLLHLFLLPGRLLDAAVDRRRDQLGKCCDCGVRCASTDRQCDQCYESEQERKQW